MIFKLVISINIISLILKFEITLISNKYYATVFDNIKHQTTIKKSSTLHNYSFLAKDTLNIRVKYCVRRRTVFGHYLGRRELGEQPLCKGFYPFVLQSPVYEDLVLEQTFYFMFHR